MKTFDVKSSINPDTYQDEYLLTIKDNKKKIKVNLDTAELLDLHEEVKHAVDTTIC